MHLDDVKFSVKEEKIKIVGAYVCPCIYVYICGFVTRSLKVDWCVVQRIYFTWE